MANKADRSRKRRKAGHRSWATRNGHIEGRHQGDSCRLRYAFRLWRESKANTLAPNGL